MKSFKTIFPSICDAITSPTCANRRGGGNLTSSHHFFNFLILTAGLLLCTQGVWGDEVLMYYTGTTSGTTLNTGDNINVNFSGTDGRCDLGGTISPTRRVSTQKVTLTLAATDNVVDLYVGGKSSSSSGTHRTVSSVLLNGKEISVDKTQYLGGDCGEIEIKNINAKKGDEITIEFGGNVYISYFRAIVGAACVPPTITSHPVSATYSQGALATALTVVASGTSLTYQWQESSDNSNWTNIANEITASYTPSTSAIGTKYYRCVVTESNDCSTNSNAATITVNAATHFTAGQTIFARSSGKGAWEADACVKAEFSDNSWGNKKEVAMVWLYNVGDITYKMFYFIVPSDNTYNHVQLNRYDPDGCTSKWNTVEWFGVDGSKNTIHSTTASSSTEGSWYSTNYEMYLKGSIDWSPNLATFTDQLNGDFAATYNNFQPSVTSYEFRVYDINGQAFGNSNTTLSGLNTNSTYNITASFNIGSRGTLNLGKEFVKGTVSFNANGHGTAPAQLTDVPANSKLTEPEVEEVLGYTLEGWYKEAGCTHKWNFETDVVTESMTLYAHWVPTQYTITYNGLEGASNPNNPTTYTIESATITFQAPGTRTGYNFASWSPASIEHGSTGNKSTTASWTPKTTAITLDANIQNHGSTGSSVTATYDNATLPAFTACTGATDYTLTGYWTNATGGLQVIDASGSLVANVSGYTDEAGKWKREDAELTLYAQYARVTSVTAEWGYYFSTTSLGDLPNNTTTSKNGITLTTNGTTHTIIHSDLLSSTTGLQINSATKYVDITIPEGTTFKAVYTSNTIVNQFEIVFCSTSSFSDSNEDIVKIVNLIGNAASNKVEQIVDKITDIPTTAKMARIRTRSRTSSGQDSNADLYYLKVEVAAPEKPTDVYAITGQFKGDEDWVDRALENGQVTLTLDKETTYPFKVKKTPQGSELFTWYTDKNYGTMTEDNHEDWVFNTVGGQDNNTNLLTAAAGQYTISVNTGGEFPVVSVSYPMSYTATFDMQGHGEQVAQQIHIANGEKAVEPATPADVTGWHFVGWYKEATCTNVFDFDNETITENTTIYAKWVTAVESISISAEGGLYEIEQGSTLQLSVIYVPEHPEYGTEITWESDNTNYLSVDENGLVTGVLASENHKITATTANGKTADYTIKVIPPTCTSVWKVHMWNTSGTNSSLCLEQVGSTDEWRTGQVILPSNSDAEKVKVLYNGGDGYHTKEWKTRWIPMVGFQAGSCKNNNDGDKYAGQNAIGYLRIYSGYTDENYYLGFQPIYAANFGIDGQGESWHRVDFAASGTGTQEEYYSERFQVPANRSTYTIYVGPKTSVNGVNEVSGLSNKVKMNTITGLTDNALEGKYGFFRINANYCDASNFNCNFVREYQMSYDANGGTGSIEPQYVSSLATGNDQKVTLADNAFERTGYSFAYYTTNAGGTGLHFNPRSEYSLNNSTGDVIMYAQWTPNPYTLTLAVGEHGTTAGSATATYDATELTDIILVTPAAGYNVTGYYSDETKVLNADGTFAATNIDGFITSGKWTKAENCTLTAHYYRDPEEICVTTNLTGDISENTTYHFLHDFTIEANLGERSSSRAYMNKDQFLIITNPNGFNNIFSVTATGYSSGHDMIYYYSENIEGSDAVFGTLDMPENDDYATFEIELPSKNIKYIKLTSASSLIAIQRVCISEPIADAVVINTNESKQIDSEVQSLIIYDGGQVTNDGNITIKHRFEYKRTVSALNRWETFAVPFDATNIQVWDDVDKASYSVYPAYGYNGKTEDTYAGYFFMKTLDQASEDNFQGAWTHTSTQYPTADTPYILCFPRTSSNGYFENKELTYIWQSSGDPLVIDNNSFETGPYPSNEDSREFKLCANTTLKVQTMEDDKAAYILTDDGTCFDLVYGATILPFSAYVIATQKLMNCCPRIMLVGGGSNPTDFVPIYSSPDMQVENRKVLIQGQIYIYRAGQIFDLTGHTIY